MARPRWEVGRQERPHGASRRWVRALLVAGASLFSLSCAAAAGAGVFAAAVGAAVATSECYGYVDVLVTEGRTGARQCDARVNARQGDDIVPFQSCFYAPLTKGTWQLSVDKPGYESVKSEISIDPRDNCQRIVHHVSVRLDSLNAPPSTDYGGPASTAAEAPLPPEAPPPPPPAAEESAPAPDEAPVAPPSAPSEPPDATSEPATAPPPPAPAAPAPAPTTPPAAPKPAPAPAPPAPKAPASPPPAKPAPPGSAEPAPPTRSFPSPG